MIRLQDNIIRNALASMFAVLVAQGAATVSLADSQDYCVTCTNPAETYICRLDAKGGNARGQQFVCIMNIAKDYQHDSCRASSEFATCEGALVRYEVVGSENPAATAEGRDQPVSAGRSEPTRNKKNAEPETLVEFTNQTMGATKKELQNAGRKTSKVVKKTGKQIGELGNQVGDNIKKATSSTWKCLTSLFSDCYKD